MTNEEKPKKKKAPKQPPLKVNMTFEELIKLAVNTPPLKKKPKKGNKNGFGE